MSDKRTSTKRLPIQQGEIVLMPIKGLPEGATRKVSEQIVAHSESGHHHVVESEVSFEVSGDIDKEELYLRLFEPAKLVHRKSFDMHRTLTVPKGDWKILHKTEYDPFSGLINRVKD